MLSLLDVVFFASGSSGQGRGARSLLLVALASLVGCAGRVPAPPPPPSSALRSEAVSAASAETGTSDSREAHAGPAVENDVAGAAVSSPPGGGGVGVVPDEGVAARGDAEPSAKMEPGRVSAGPGGVSPVEGSADHQAGSDEEPGMAVAAAYVFPPDRTVSSSAQTDPRNRGRDGESQAGVLEGRSGGSEAASGGEIESPGRYPPSTPRDTSGAATSQPLRLSIVPSARIVAIGEVVSIDVMASSAVAINDAPLHVRFDPAVLEYVDGSPGEFLSRGGSSVVFLVDGKTVAGDVAVGIGRIERAHGATGEGLLCRLRLKGVAAGETTVVASPAMAWDTRGAEVTVETRGRAVEVRSSTNGD